MLSYLIYLPPGYNAANKTVKYPVLYFLHGSTADQNAYKPLVQFFDLFISSGQIQKMIIVLPDGSHKPFAGSFYTNSSIYGKYEDYIAQDLVTHIDSTYNTFAVREKRGMMGHSMGAYGAIKMGVKYPEKYCVAAGLSGPLNLTLFNDILPLVLNEYGNKPPYTFIPSSDRIFTLESYTMAGAFSPNMQNPPYYVDFPIDKNGVMIKSITDRWQPNNPAMIVTKLDPKKAPQLYFDCGDKDEFHLMSQNQSFADSLKKYNIPYKFEKFVGGHTDQLAFRAPIALVFVDAAFKGWATSVENPSVATNDFVINKFYPSMINGLLNIEVESAKQQSPEFIMYSINGQKITSKRFDNVKGKQTIQFSTGNIPKGIYIFLVKIDNIIVQSLKVLK
jgi:enterochelin esterase-like enzyme